MNDREDDKKKTGKRRRRCRGCGHLKYGVRQDIDPYTEDIRGKRVLVVMCPDCFYASVMDI